MILFLLDGVANPVQHDFILLDGVANPVQHEHDFISAGRGTLWTGLQTPSNMRTPSNMSMILFLLDGERYGRGCKPRPT
jgi:hypothetical protein